MTWSSVKKNKPDPTYGFYEVTIRFAWFPVNTGWDWIWLEKYRSVRIWTKNARCVQGDMDCYYFDGWVKTAEKI